MHDRRSNRSRIGFEEGWISIRKVYCNKTKPIRTISYIYCLSRNNSSLWFVNELFINNENMKSQHPADVYCMVMLYSLPFAVLIASITVFAMFGAYLLCNSFSDGILALLVTTVTLIGFCLALMISCFFSSHLKLEANGEK